MDSKPLPAGERFSIPVELIVKILRYLGIHDLLRCRLVCKDFRAMIDKVSELQYALDLAVYGLVEVNGPAPGCSLDIRERRKLLNQYQDMRRHRDRRWLPLPESSINYIVPMFRRASGLSMYIGNVLLSKSESDAVHTLHFLALIPRYNGPSLSSEVEVACWSRTFSRFVAFSADPGQDLLVLVSEALEVVGTDVLRFNLRLISLSPRDIPHTDGRDISILIDRHSTGHFHVARVLVHGKTIGLVYMSPSFEETYHTVVILIDSGSGVIFARLSRSFRSTSMLTEAGREYPNVALLTETSFAMVTAHQTYLAIEVYAVADHSEGVESHEDNKALRPIAHVATFQLPPFRPGTTFVPREQCFTSSFHRRYTPRPGHLHDISINNPALSFDISPSSCLFHVNLLYTAPQPDNPNGRRQSMEIKHIIRLAPFFAVVDAYQTGKCDPEEGGPRLIPWEAWGPQNSRSVYMQAYVANAFASHGSRVLGTHGTARTESIMDFNTLPEARMASLGAVDDTVSAGYRFVGKDAPMIVPRGDIFMENIAGTLPYYESINPPLHAFTLWRRFLGGDVWFSQDTLSNFEERYYTLVA